ncbi:MAG: Crp/Fnr family transcriptional regulator [Sphingomonadales bacterium]|nr:Crp/Fnr family transcriptional regulator [Sphingomonadales bacterium]
MSEIVRQSLMDLLEPAEVALVQAFAIRRSYRDREVIHERGDETQSVGIVAKGQVRLLHLARGGQELLLSVLLPGDNYGDILALAGGSRSHRAVASGDTAVDHIPADAFRQLLIHPAIVRAFYTIASSRLEVAISRFDDMRTLPSEVRLAKLLLELRRASPDERVACLQEDLASLTGVSTVTLAKSLTLLKREGLVETGYRHLIVQDVAGLADWVAKREAD